MDETITEQQAIAELRREMAARVAQAAAPKGMRIVPAKNPTGRAPVSKAEWDQLAQWQKNRTPYYEPDPTAQESPADNKPSPGPDGVYRLLLKHRLSPGDVLVMTAAVRDLKRAYGGRVRIAVNTSCGEIWNHNPHVEPADRTFHPIDCRYPSIHRSNQGGLHFIEGFAADIAKATGLPFELTDLRGDIHLSSAERRDHPIHALAPGQWDGTTPLWLMLAPGGKYDYTAKWWNPAHAQAVVDHFRGRITFVRCGEARHHHPPLAGTIDCVGKTKLRQFIHLMHWADGVVCPVTFAMHLAAAVPTRDGRERSCVVIAGGREPVAWERYPGHQFLHTVGYYDCCRHGGCWRSRCQQVGDGDAKDTQNRCALPVLTDFDYTRKDGVREKLAVPRCMDDITPQMVIDAIGRCLHASGD